MTDYRLFGFEWIIDNASAKFTSGQAESKVFKEDGFEWRAGFRPKNSEEVEFTLSCEHPRGVGEWKCEAEYTFSLFNVLTRCSNPPFRGFKTLAKFNNEEKVHDMGSLISSALIESKFVCPLRAVGLHPLHFTERRRTEYCQGVPIIDLTKFSSPNESNDVTLLIGDKKLKVSKDYLALNSPVFSSMFFGEFAENGKDEVEIKDVTYGEFLDLLHFIYPGMVPITDHTVLHILKLADRFQIEHVVALSKKHLIEKSSIDIAKKLFAADQYGFTDLRSRSLNFALLAFTVTDLIEKLRSSLEFKKFSADMKAFICERMVEKGRNW